jgi:hypothetical protein
MYRPLPSGKGIQRSTDDEGRDWAFNHLHERLPDMKLKGPVERMLGAQMIAVHEAAMECLRRGMVPGQTFESRGLNFSTTAKFMKLFERQVAALYKHRGKGQQNVVVKHVHVGPGGQAVVGNVATENKLRSQVAPLALETPKENPMETLSTGFVPAEHAMQPRTDHD